MLSVGGRSPVQVSGVEVWLVMVRGVYCVTVGPMWTAPALARTGHCTSGIEAAAIARSGQGRSTG